MSRIAKMRMSMCPPVRLLGIAWLMIAIAAGPNSGHAFLQPAQRPSASADQRTGAARWFQDAKLGLFVHWGVYSLLGKGEWVMENDKIPIREYAKLPRDSIRRGSTPLPGSSWPNPQGRNTSPSPPSTTTASACSPAV